MDTPRGIRLNNPGNIRKGNAPWVGMASGQPDPDFVNFRAPVYGIRALMKILNTYYETYSLLTIAQIITRYAPPAENDTPAYIVDVAKRSGVAADSVIDDMSTMVIPLAEVISIHENGHAPEGTPAYWYDDATYAAAKVMAFS
jgi:hypothetical protein